MYKISVPINIKLINFVNCSGTLDGDNVKLSDITPYGFAAFEVTE